MKHGVRPVLYYAAAVVITALVSVAVTITVMNRQKGERVVLNSVEYQAYQEIAPLLELKETIEAEHFGKQVTEEALLKGAINGMIAELNDPYARYYTKEEYVAYLQQLGGSYHGIGALVGQPEGEGVPVLKVYEDSPAEKAGLLAGDAITAVDGKSLTGLTLEEVEALFSGEDGAAVEIVLFRNGEYKTLSIVRGQGVTQRVTRKLLNQRTGYIRLDKFTGTAADEFAEALRDLTDRGMRSLVIDIRDNPGGELSQVVAVADALMKEGVIVSVRGTDGQEEVFRSDAKGINVPLAVLVNENSASASEILAAAIQDSGTGTVVGTKTYGKGVVQTTVQLESNGGWVKLTTAAYYTPSGEYVDGTGVQPDIDIDLADNVKGLPIVRIDEDDDAQLWAALDEVREQADALAAS
ncbi:MAG TPA: S41 family peptidase [Feifaniaceae bacterium]|nr:S41 family peptidase [Feifaniaceae bacterium]